MRQQLQEEALILRTQIKKLHALMALLVKTSEEIDSLMSSDEVITAEDVQTIRETNDIIIDQLDMENDSSIAIGVEKLAGVMAVTR